MAKETKEEKMKKKNLTQEKEKSNPRKRKAERISEDK